jgi:hypothetical protein
LLLLVEVEVALGTLEVEVPEHFYIKNQPPSREP